MSNNSKITTYDPTNPTDAQLENLISLQNSDFNADDLLNPGVVQMLLQQHGFSLMKVKSLEKDLSSLQKKNNELRDDRETLRIRIAKSRTDSRVQLAQILISVLGGFAINMLTTDWTNGLGWVLLLLSISIVIAFGIPKFVEPLENSLNKEKLQ